MSEPTPKALERHREACRNEESGYEDPETGLFVMSSYYLSEFQGECCGSGCRHCPWGADEQRRAGRTPGANCWPYRPETDGADTTD